MSSFDTMLGHPIASNEADEHRVSSAAASVLTFGLDALSSAACGPEAGIDETENSWGISPQSISPWLRLYGHELGVWFDQL